MKAAFHPRWSDSSGAGLLHSTLIFSEGKADKNQGKASTGTPVIQVDEDKVHFG